ncbi:MAG: peptide chain release factor 1 [Acidimicrobiia bacterium]
MSLLDRLVGLEREFADLEVALADPELLADPRRSADSGRRYRALGDLVVRLRELQSATDDLVTAREMLTDADPVDRDVLRAEIDGAETTIARLEEEIRVLLLPADPNDGRAVIAEIRGAEGGEEANLFARDLFDMYRAWATRRGWTFEVMEAQPSDLGGYIDVTFRLAGDGAWTHMKFEGGPHRVQRVPVTESQGRVHTSSAVVTVLPEADDIDVQIDPADLRIDTYRSSGAGGQHVNVTDSAVRITHVPTGVVVAMQDEKSQLQNREKALRVLRSRLLQAEQERQAAEASGARRAQSGAGGRSEKIRTYNFKENRVTDHRIGLTLHRLDRILAGDLDEFVDALIADERAAQLRDGAS